MLRIRYLGQGRSRTRRPAGTARSRRGLRLSLGNALLWFTALATGTAILAYATASRRGGGLRLARLALYASTLGLLATSAWLWRLILTHRFDVAYVYRYSALDMPLRYVIASFWGGQEGTFLLWAVYGGLLALALRFRAGRYEAPVQVFYMGITFFLTLILLKRSPFTLLDTVPHDGNGLNPLLQDPWMTIHPPVMFFGFASMGIPAAYAMAAMVRRDWDDWVPRALPWTLFGVAALGAGLTLGGYWAYSILGWGGYWGWDPVENSSLVPWLVAVGLVHNLVVQIHRGRFRRTNLLLAMLPFLLLTYSTFLTRSGVLADFSVHSFTDLGINQFLVAFMAVFSAAGVGLFAWRFRSVPAGESGAGSRYSLMLLGSAALASFASLVCLGTSAPLISRGAVQPEFYNRAAMPFALALCLLMATAPHLGARWAEGRVLRRLAAPLVIALLLLPVLIHAFGGVLPAVVTAAGVLALVSNVGVVFRLARRRVLSAGGFLAHVGVGLMVVGILTSTGMGKKVTLELPAGTDVNSLGYTWRFLGSRAVNDGRKTALDLTAHAGDRSVVLTPTLSTTPYAAGVIRRPDIHHFAFHDLYVSPGDLDHEPVEHRTQARLVLREGETASALGMDVTLRGLSAVGDAASASTPVTATLTVKAAGQESVIAPVFGSGDPGAEEARIPGTGFFARMDGVDRTNRRIRLDLGLPPLVLGVGETGDLAGYQVTFHGFNADMGGPGGTVTVQARATVVQGGRSVRLVPEVIQRGTQREEHEAPIADTGDVLVLTEIDAGGGRAGFLIAPAPTETLWVEASTKPFIGVLWAGTGLVLLGVITAAVERARIVRRRRDARAGGEREGLPQAAA